MLILFLKARAKWDTHTPDLFDAITQVHGYTRADGTFVQPHSAHRLHAVEPHHVVDVANLSNNEGKPHKEPQMESSAAAKTPGMSRDEAIDFGKRSALEALDQGELYGTVQDTIDTYRDNVRDTLNEKRAADFEQDAFNAFDQVISASKPAPEPTQEVTVDADGFTRYGPVTPPNQRDVPEHLLERVEAIIAKANKRAVKLGVEGTKQTLVSRCAVIKPKPVKVKAAKKLIVRTTEFT